MSLTGNLVDRLYRHISEEQDRRVAAERELTEVRSALATKEREISNLQEEHRNAERWVNFYYAEDARKDGALREIQRDLTCHPWPAYAHLVKVAADALSGAPAPQPCQSCNGMRVRVYPGTPLGDVEICRECGGKGELATSPQEPGRRGDAQVIQEAERERVAKRCAEIADRHRTAWLNSVPADSEKDKAMLSGRADGALIVAAEIRREFSLAEN